MHDDPESDIAAEEHDDDRDLYGRHPDEPWLRDRCVIPGTCIVSDPYHGPDECRTGDDGALDDDAEERALDRIGRAARVGELVARADRREDVAAGSAGADLGGEG